MDNRLVLSLVDLDSLRPVVAAIVLDSDRTWAERSLVRAVALGILVVADNPHIVAVATDLAGWDRTWPRLVDEPPQSNESLVVVVAHLRSSTSCRGSSNQNTLKPGKGNRSDLKIEKNFHSIK